MSPHETLGVPTTSLIIVVKTFSLLLGSLIAYYSYRAYIRTSASSLRALTVGFILVTLGALLGGFSHQVLDLNIMTGVLIDSLLITAGFAVILYSLYIQD